MDRKRWVSRQFEVTSLWNEEQNRKDGLKVAFTGDSSFLNEKVEPYCQPITADLTADNSIADIRSLSEAFEMFGLEVDEQGNYGYSDEDEEGLEVFEGIDNKGNYSFGDETDHANLAEL